MKRIALNIVLVILGILLVYTGLVLAQENDTGNQTNNITLSCDSNNLNLCYV